MMLVALAGRVNEEQHAVIEYLKEENRVLRSIHLREQGVRGASAGVRGAVSGVVLRDASPLQIVRNTR